MADLASTTLKYLADGSSNRIDDLGMRSMQQRVWSKRESRYLLIKSPPASGKSRAAMFVALDKLQNQGLKKVIIAVPERAIGRSFRDTDLANHGFFANWKVDCDLCSVGSETGSKARNLLNFLDSTDEKIAVCTHSTLRSVYTKVEIEDLDSCFICIDEFHHTSVDENSRLGELVGDLIDRNRAHIMAMTGSYFRGDGYAILKPEDESLFDRVVYTYYEQLNGYDHLKSLGIGFHFYKGRYLNSISDVLDPKLKTIIHIPHVRSSEAIVHKNYEVDEIISTLGDLLDTEESTGFHKVKTGHGIIKVANLVDDGPDREKVISSLRNISRRDDVDIIIALGMAKEGFDWIWCEHVLTVGYRGSLTEVVQIIGRCTRDAPGKEHAQFTNLISTPFANDEVVTKSVNDMLKAISVSLLMEQVMAPTFRFRTHTGSDDLTGRRWESEDPVTNFGEIEVLTNQKFDDQVKEDMVGNTADIIAEVQGDPRALTVMIDPDNHYPDVTYDLITRQIVSRRYPNYTEEQVEDAVNLIHFQTSLARKIHDNPGVVHESSDGSASAVDAEADGDGKSDSESRPTANVGPSGGDNFVRMARRFVDVRDLEVDLIGARHDYPDAYELLSKTFSEDLLRQLHGEVRAMRILMTIEEAEQLYPRIKEFVNREGREPMLVAQNGREVRLAEALAFLRRERRRRSQGKVDKKGDTDNESS